MRKHFLFLILFSVLATSLFAAGNVINKNGAYYYADKLVVKFTSNVASLESLNLSPKTSKALEYLGVTNIVRTVQAVNNSTEAAHELSRFYTLELKTLYNIEYIAKKMSKLSDVEWAEPYYLYTTAYTPNDPLQSSQGFLNVIKAFEAWDVTTGSSDVIIAVDDTGVDWDHPDLAVNIWVNEAEANGTDNVDDDNNGYIDDLRGWDFGGLNGTPDNNPMEDRPDHGTHVAGCAAEVTDNNTGGAGIGFNCTIMPVKTARDDVRDNGNALISYGYQGIVYAVDNGADIINCSWGGSTYSLFAKSVIDYAVENNVLVVASAGNDGQEMLNYPGAYDGVLAVAATFNSDDKAGFSNYGYWVDVAAPGVGVYATWQNDTYTGLSGTSMSSPVVAGIAGLVKSVFPEYSGMQLAQQIRATTDDISATNPGYDYKLGTGRVNAYRAVTESGAVSARAVEYTFIDEGNGNGVLEPGETVALRVNFHNYLAVTNALTVTFSANDSYILTSNNTFNAGSVGANTAFDNTDNEFRFEVRNNIPSNATLEFRLDFSDGTYTDYQFSSVILNPSYFDHNGNNMTVTITSRGNIGYNDFPDNSQGNGVRFLDGDNLNFEGSLMIGASTSQVMDVARDAVNDASDTDFQVHTPFLMSKPGTIAEEQGYGVFTDAGAPNPIGLEIDQHTFAFTADEDANYVLLKYVIRNTSGSELDNIYAGLFMDWDVDEDYYGTNVASWDEAGMFGLVNNDDTSLVPYYCATALVSDESYNFYAIENGGTPSIYDGFTAAEKYTTLSSGTTNNSAGPDDISTVVSGGPYSIAAGEYIEVGFAVAIDTTLDGLRQTITNSRTKYASIVTDVEDEEVAVPVEFSLSQNYPNPFNPVTTIKYSVASETMVKLRVYDILGREVATLVNTVQKTGSHEIKFDASNLSSGIYFYSIEAGNFRDSQKMTLLK